MTSYEQIKRIYEKLEDKVSRDIFMKRLQYSLSGDKGYIYEMVSAEMRRYGNDDIMMCFLEWMEKKEKPTVIFGAGCAGMQIASVLAFAGKPATGFIDNNEKLWGSEVMGLKVYSPQILKEKEEYIVAIGTNYYVQEIEKQLSEMGIAEERIFTPQKEWWLGKDTQYFDSGIMQAHANESFIDGGALDGVDSVKFIQWCNGNYDAAYLFEPDEDNYKKLIPLRNENKKFIIYKEGLWSGSGELAFCAGNKEKCTISENGDTVIKVTSIDEKLQGKPVSFIKMDIEGSEMEALKGAENTIGKYKPRLAICVYHKPEDIIEIPLKILELNPEYKLYLRHYSYIHTETVLYAI
ncbi:MAG TPA: hypothetical protein DCZ40_00310 [Lachnospiraceae bacterium]|nr:hypothetical protein [Lachnospiraceae bacterium]